MTVQTVLLHSKVKDVLGELQREPWEEHLGINKTQDKIKQWCYWLHASSDVQMWCSPCDILQQAKVQVLNGLMHQYNVGALFEQITLDLQSKRGKRPGLLHQMPEAYTLHNQEALMVTDALEGNFYHSEI